MRYRLISSLPNTLSIFRCIGAFLFFFVNDYAWRIAFLSIFACTDFLDGFIARRYNAQSRLGTLLDPLADKVLAFICTYIYLVEGRLSTLESAYLFTREITLIIFWGFLIVSDRWRYWNIQSFWIGKLVTTLQFTIFIILTYTYPLPSYIYHVMGCIGFFSLLELTYRAVSTSKSIS